MPQAIEISDDVPVITGTVNRATREPGPRAIQYRPALISGADTSILSVTVPAHGGAGGGSGVDPTLLSQLRADLDALDGRLDTLEGAPSPSSAPTGPAGGDLTGFYPNPTLGQSYATQSALTAGLGAKANRQSIRSVSTGVIAQINEVLKVNASSGPISIGPPVGTEAGDRVTVIKTDTSSNEITWNAATNSDADAQITGQWSGATFVYDGAGLWIVQSVNVSYSGAATGTGGTTNGITREQADARYDALGAANTALGQVTKATVGLGNVDNVADVNKPISTAVQAALNGKADTVAVFNRTATGATTLNAANGNYQSITALGNIVLAPPENPSDQQGMRIEVFSQPGSTKSVTMLSAITNASGQPLPFTVQSARFAVLGLVYSARAGRWMLLSYTVEPA